MNVSNPFERTSGSTIDARGDDATERHYAAAPPGGWDADAPRNVEALNQPRSLVSRGAFAGLRAGSKDARLAELADQLGRVPDSDIARKAGVSIRTVASFRARHGISGFDGPRRKPQPRHGKSSALEDVHVLMGQIPDRCIADETGMSLGAVRNYRLKNDIEPAGRMTRREIEQALDAWRNRREAVNRPIRPEGAAQSAWQVRVADGKVGIIVAYDAREALELAARVAGGHVEQVVAMERIGSMFGDGLREG